MREGRLIAMVMSGIVLFGCPKKQQPTTTTAPEALRPPAVAGSFYPSDPGQLRAMVEDFLARARRGAGNSAARAPALDEQVVAILVPHAGYVFSGLTAACAFAACEGREYDTVILIGTPHTAPIRGAAVFCGRGFATPIGVVPVDTRFTRAITAASPLIRDDPTPHAAEHSLEVQLPFLVSVLKGARIVPILVMGDTATLRSVARSLIETIRKTPGGFSRTLIVISSDLAHYPTAADALASDREILTAFCSLDPDALLAADRSIMERKMPNLVCSMCGLNTAYVGLELARAAGATAARLLDTRTSADAGVSGATADKVVGYGAVLITRPARAKGTDRIESRVQLLEPLDSYEQKVLLGIARQSIEEYLKTGKKTAFTAPANCPHLLENRGCFVTLYDVSKPEQAAGNKLKLRGCVGNIDPRVPLVTLAPQLALSSAFEDPRFPPLKVTELRGLRIEISVYRTGLVPIASAEEFETRTHGIVLRVGGAEATFLPQVAAEQGWDTTATLENLCLKAGLRRDAWKSREARLFVYQTQIFRE
jgi:AmmeMemoRadiSam system protein B/AmmeMemoRadiSam system protein A